MRGSMRMALGLAAFAGLLAVAGVPQRAQAFDRECRFECFEARRICHRAAHTAYRVCHRGCDRLVHEAVERARQVCDARELGPRECFELILKAVREAAGGCRERCQAVRQEARARCEEERAECREACLAPLDGECVDACIEEFGVCRDELDACTDGCESAAEEALARCRDLVDDRPAFRRCLEEARHEGRVCSLACHEESPCGRDFHGCLGECVVRE